MDKIEGQVKAEYRLQPTALDLLHIKKAHEASRRLLNQEIISARRSLAEKVRLLRQRSRQLAQNSIYRKLNTEINFLMDSARTFHEKSILHSNSECLNLAMLIAKEILQDEVVLNTESLSKRIKKAAEKLFTTEPIEVTVNELQISEIKNIFQHYPSKIKFSTDKNVEPGNAVIKTSTGSVILSWKTQLEIMQTLLVSKLKQSVCS